MTALQHPFVVVLPVFCIGLTAGYYFPSEFYLAPAIAVGAFAWWMSRKNKPLWADLSILLLCLLIGAQRMSASLLDTGEEQELSILEKKAAKISDTLAARFKDAGLQGDEMHLTAALVLGKRSELSSETKDKFRQVGASHLLALSGMHLGIIYGLLCIICVRWVRFSPFRWIALPLLVCGLWTYTLLAGMPAALIRAAAMLSMVCMGTLLFRSLPLLHTLSFSACIILFVNPLLLTDIGFQLSCMAVLFIALAYMPLHGCFRSWPFALRWPARMLLLSLSAQIGTLPLSAYYFHSLPLLGPFASLFLVPVTTALIYGGLCTLIFPLPVLASFTALCVRAELWILETWINLFPSSMWDTLHPSLPSVILIYVVLLAGFIRIYWQASEMNRQHVSL